MGNISGIFKAKKRWELVCLSNNMDEQNQYMRYENFERLVRKNFEKDSADIILGKIVSEEELLIDFDNKKVNIIEEYDEPFIKSMGTYFNPTFLQQQKDDEQLLEETNLYE